MPYHTVIHAADGVEVVSGDLSVDPQRQHRKGCGRFWVAVASDGPTAQRWAGIYRQYLTDRFPQRFFSRLLELLTEGVPKQFIIPSPRNGA